MTVLILVLGLPGVLQDVEAFIQRGVTEYGFATFHCSICGKDFNGNKSHCKRHIQMVHQPQTAIQCEVCQKQYKNKETVRAHERSVHGIYRALK